MNPLAPSDVFVGRQRELEELRTGLEEVRTGTGRLVTLVGEPGIGKTRLADELAESASDGCIVVWGRCWEGGSAPVYWPWVQILRALARLVGDPVLAGRGEEEAGGLDALAAAAEGHLLQPSEVWTIHDSVGRYLVEVSDSTPLVLVLDDLHVADEPSLNLLSFIARGLRHTHIMVLGTYRDIDARLDPAVSSALARIEREGSRIMLSGFSTSEVRTMLQSMTGTRPLEGLVATIARASDGNPLFVREIVRFLTADIDLTRADESTGVLVPHSIREVFRRRLELLPDETIRTLSAAAVVGREFDIEILSRAIGERRDEVAERLEEAERVGIVSLVGGPGLYGFSHALLREALYDDLTTAMRMRLHAQIAVTLEDLQPEGHLPELAHHFFKAAHAGDLQKAVEYNVRAGQSAEGLGAFDQAARHYRRALRVGDAAVMDDDLRRQLVEALSNAENQAAGNPASGVESEETAASLSLDGDFWTVVFAGNTTLAKDSKGMRYIARMISDPGREFHALDLVTSFDEFARAAAGRRQGGDADLVLDREAKVRYRARLEELAEDIAEAEAFGETERAVRAREEVDAITAELARAVGLGGRDRRVASTSERARLSVTKAVRAAITNLSKSDPVLGGHLAVSVKTGTYCTYNPDPTAKVTWRT